MNPRNEEAQAPEKGLLSHRKKKKKTVRTTGFFKRILEDI
jgi:hypothetical protein